MTEAASRATFELRLGPLGPAELTVASFRGREAMSRPFVFDVLFVAELDGLALDPTLLGTPAALLMRHAGPAPRVVQGIAGSLGTRGVTNDGRKVYRLRLVPRLQLLARRRNSRIFQNLSLVDIVDAILAPHGVDRRWNLASTYKPRAYAVQYRETDLAFVTRLCAEEGIFFHFEPPPLTLDAIGPLDGVERVVFCDAAGRCPPMAIAGVEAAASAAASADLAGLPAPPLPFRLRGDALVGEEHADRFDVRRSLRTQSIHVHDYDFERPLFDLSADASPADDPFDAVGSARLEAYEHDGEYWEPDVTPENAAVRLEQYRARAVLAKGASVCTRLAPGARFLLEGHPQPDVDHREYTVVEVDHRGTWAGARLDAGGAAPDRVYDNTFTCVPAAVPYRPPRPSRDLAHVLESAVVVGPAGEEVYTDRLGRIKVQFHWDRDGERNESSSCWMRVLQPWAGASWGFQFLPRVGMEVLVSFLGGDEDRPVVMGAVYNATHPPPFALPHGKTRSGIRSQSVGGEGGSEISFEDGAGTEILAIRSQRDLVETAQRDHALNVGGDQRVDVTGGQVARVGGERHATVGGDDTRSVTGSSLASVAGDARESVGGQRQDTVAGAAISRVHGAYMHNGHNHAAVVEGFASLTVGAEEKPAALNVMVYGSESHDATKTIAIRSDTRIVLECGDTSVAITPDSVRIDAKTIVLKAKEKLVLLGDGPGIELSKEADILADTIKIFSKGGSVELDSNAARVDGPVVKLNCGADDAPDIDDDAPKKKTKPFRWRCLDAMLAPYENKTYRLVTQGFKCKDTTDGDGVISKDIPDDAFTAHVTLWTEGFPEGERIQYTIRLDDLPPASSIAGALLRLRNLGYYAGPDVEDATPELGSAISLFQEDNGLPLSGALEGATIGKLSSVHP